MSLYHIWNPHLVEQKPARLVFFVGKGDTDQIAEGTDEFVAHLLKDLKVSQKPVEWKMAPCRSSYFVEDPDSDSWRDQWVISWRLEVVLPSPAKIAAPKIGSLRTDAEDASWDADSPRHHRKLKGAHALVIADFKTQAALETAREAIVALGKKVGKPTFTVSQALGKFPELQVDLGERPNSFFEGGAEAAVEVAAACEKHGGATNHRDSFRRAS